MNKDDLLKLKKELESIKGEYSPILRTDKYFNQTEEQQTYYQGKKMNISELQKKVNTDYAIDKIMSNFKCAIYYYSETFTKFDTMTITPCIFPFVSTKDINNNHEDEDIATLKENPKILDDIVMIDLYHLLTFNDGKVVSEVAESEYIKNYDTTTNFIVSLEELKKGLLLKGLELKGIDKTSELLENNYLGTITIDFGKAKKRILEKNN